MYCVLGMLAHCILKTIIHRGQPALFADEKNLKLGEVRSFVTCCIADKCSHQFFLAAKSRLSLWGWEAIMQPFFFYSQMPKTSIGTCQANSPFLLKVCPAKVNSVYQYFVTICFASVEDPMALYYSSEGNGSIAYLYVMLWLKKWYFGEVEGHWPSIEIPESFHKQWEGGKVQEFI